MLTSMFYNTPPFMISTSSAALPAPASSLTSHSSARLSRFWSLLAAGSASSLAEPSRGCGGADTGDLWFSWRYGGGFLQWHWTPFPSLVSVISLSLSFYNLKSTCITKFGTLIEWFGFKRTLKIIFQPFPGQGYFSLDQIVQSSIQPGPSTTTSEFGFFFLSVLVFCFVLFFPF